jgi:hypothetical protein
MPKPQFPADIADALHRLEDDLKLAAGENFAALVLYGGLARGRFRPGKSDVNLLVLLHDAGLPALEAVMPALRAARRAAGVDPMVLTPAELPRAAAAFPTKFLDIRNHHLVLAGEDPFPALEVNREEVRQRVVQALQNLLMRLRQGYFAAGGDVPALARTLAQVARPLALELEALLWLQGLEVPADDRSASVFAAAAQAFALDGDALAGLAGLRHGAPAGDLDTLWRGVLETVARAAELADQAPKVSG